MSDEDSPGNTIRFTDKHIDLIRQGEKTSTLRTIKKDNFYPEGSTAQIEGTDIEIAIYRRNIVKIGAYTRPLDPDTGCFIDDVELAHSEGFIHYDELLQWFENKNYNLPQSMFRYRFYTLTPQGTKDEVQESLDSIEEEE